MQKVAVFTRQCTFEDLSGFDLGGCSDSFKNKEEFTAFTDFGLHLDSRTMGFNDAFAKGKADSESHRLILGFYLFELSKEFLERFFRNAATVVLHANFYSLRNR